MNRSVSPNQRSSSRSPSRSAVKSNRPASTLELNVDAQIEKLKQNRERVLTTLETYTLLIRSNTPLRCLQHNSNLSIYCETERKLLCTSCVFGKNVHKFHKICPIDKATDLIKNDMGEFNNYISNTISNLDQSQKFLQENSKAEEQQAFAAIQTLLRIYQNCQNELQSSFNRSKDIVLNALNTVQMRHESMLVQVDFLKRIHEDRLTHQDPIITNQQLLYNHIITQTLIEHGRFEGYKWKTPRFVMKNVAEQEIRKIESIEKLINKFLDTQASQKALLSEAVISSPQATLR